MIDTLKMKKIVFPNLIGFLLLISCGNDRMNNDDLYRIQRLADSIATIEKAKTEMEQALLHSEKVKRDSIVSIEEAIAIGEIKFGIGKSQFKRDKQLFLSKCKLPEIEFHKLRTIFWYKLGEYGFGDLHGWFHNNELYMIQFYGGIVRYDEYDIVFPDQFRLLMNLLKLKYGEPSFEHGLPKWTDVEKGSFHRCSVWYIGKKKVEVRVSCEGVSYRLDLVVERPDIKVKVRHEKEKQNTESIKKAVEIL